MSMGPRLRAYQKELQTCSCKWLPCQVFIKWSMHKHDRLPVVNGSYWTNLGLKNHSKILTSIVVYYRQIDIIRGHLIWTSWRPRLKIWTSWAEFFGRFDAQTPAIENPAWEGSHGTGGRQDKTASMCGPTHPTGCGISRTELIYTAAATIWQWMPSTHPPRSDPPA